LPNNRKLRGTVLLTLKRNSLRRYVSLKHFCRKPRASIQAHADVPWRSMRNMRNRMAHGYFDINLDVVWETVQEWLPALLQQLPAVRQDADDEDRNDKGMEP